MVAALALVWNILRVISRFPLAWDSVVAVSTPWPSLPTQPYPQSWLHLQQAMDVPKVLLVSC